MGSLSILQETVVARLNLVASQAQSRYGMMAGRGGASMRQVAPRDSTTMLAALGILAYAASMMTHEALGHGGYCLAAGGHNVMLTAWWETCNFSTDSALGTKAAGPGVQFGAGLLAWLVLQLLSPNATRLRCFLWLYMVFNLFVSSSYVAFSGVTDLGDAAELVARLHPPIVWRGGLILLGALVYFLSMRATALELKRFAGRDDEIKRLFRLVWIPYAAAGVFACCTGALTQTLGVTGLAVAAPAMYRTMGHGAVIGLAVASSFGAGSGMFGLPNMQRGMASRGFSPAVYLKWSAAWGVVAATVIVLFLFCIGPGLK